MGAVVSCIESVFRTIGRVIMAIINGVGSIIMAIVSGVVTLLDVIVGFLTCNTCGGRRRSGTGSRRRFGRSHRHTTTSAI